MACLLAAGGAWLGLTWVGYPAWLAAKARLAGTTGHAASSFNRSAAATAAGNANAGFAGALAVVIVVRNEAHHIGARLAELRALRVPDGCMLRVVLVDDGSIDETAKIALAAAFQPGPRLDYVRQPASGKAVGLALGVAHAGDADVIVFADVRQRIPATALAALIAPFAEPGVGVVSGVVAKPARGGPGLYWRYETWVRRLESRTGSTIGATGPWYAIRRALFVAPPRGLLLDDVWIPMRAVFAGARAVVAEGAVVTDVEHATATERDKKARTLTGNLQLLEAWPALLDPRRNPLWARYLVHKVFRLGTPFAVGAIVAGSVASALTPGPLQPVGVALVAGEALVVAAALAGWAPARTALAVQRASLEAWWRWARRDFRWAT